MPFFLKLVINDLGTSFNTILTKLLLTAVFKLLMKNIRLGQMADHFIDHD